MGWNKNFSFVAQNHICYLFLPMCEVSSLHEKRTGTLSAAGSQKESFSAGKGFCFMGRCLLSEVLGICWRPCRSLCSLSALFVLMLQTYVQACTHMVWAQTHNQHACLQMEEEKKKSFLVILANRMPINLAFNVGSRQSPLRQSKCSETDHARQYYGLKSGWIIPAFMSLLSVFPSASLTLSTLLTIVYSERVISTFQTDLLYVLLKTRG